LLFRNTLAQSTTTITSMIFSVILAPIMLSRLGLAAFGVWAVTGAFATYATVFDLGITRALGRFVALYDSSGEDRKLRECIGLGLIAVTIVGVVVIATAYLVAPLFASSLGVLDTADMRIVLLCSAGILTALLFKKVLNAVPHGLRRMVPPNVASTAGNVVNFALSVGILVVSSSLVDYALVNLLAAFLGIFGALASTLYVRRPLPVAWPSRETTREILGFSVNVQVPWIADMVNQQTDKIVIAFLIDVKVAAAFEIAGRVTNAVKAVGVLTTSAMVPTATAYIVERGRQAVPAFHLRYSRMSVALAFPLFVLVCVSAPALLFAWLGEVPDATEAVLIGLSVSHFFGLAAGVAGTLAMGAGRAGMLALTAALSAALNVVLTVALAPLFGTWGVLAATIVAIAVGAVAFLRNFHREFGVSTAAFLRAIGPPTALAVGAGVPLGVYTLAFADLGSQREAAVVLAAVVLVYGATYWVLASRLGYLPRRLTLSRARRPAPSRDEALAGTSGPTR
jgi:O-antigen/teichoic acid export membrane protein